MKIITQLTAILTLGIALFATSCKKDEPAPKELTFKVSSETIGGVDYTKIQGTINENYTFTSDKKWLISGGLFVDKGYTLTIQAGTFIYGADDGTTPFLSILRGAKIDAQGTAILPIVMTSVKSVPAPGDWGGVILNGYAKINVTGGEAEGEGGSGTYGGADDSDNSGIMRYVRIEWAGRILGTDNELNGLAFQGVGSGTTIEYIQAYRGSDDGFEWFGGTVNARFLVSTGNQDDSFDWTQGWRGNGQFFVAQQNTDAGDRGFECDNNGDDNAATPFSEPTISNVTLIGVDDGDGKNTGMRLRAGTKGKLYNFIVTGFPKYGVRVSDEAPSTQTEDNMNDGSLVVKSTISFGNTTNWKDCTPFESDQSNQANDLSFLNGYVGVFTGAKATDPTTLGSFFVTGEYIGAVPSNNDWTTGWTRDL